MAFFAPLIGTAIGGIATTAVGQAVVGIGLSIGASALSRKLKPKSGGTGSNAGMRLSLNTATNKPREIAFGVCASTGSHEYHNAYGPNGNDYVQLVRRLADVPCTGLERIYVNGKPVTLGNYVSDGNVSGYSVVEYPGGMWVEFHDGAWGQPADTDLVSKATGSAWSPNNRGRGVCYVRITLKYDAEQYKDGLPEFLFVFKGAKLYDWRKDSTAGGVGAHRWGQENTYEWTHNAAVIVYNYMRGVYVNGHKVGGLSVPVSSLPYDDWTAAANACDETVGLKDGGSEARYRLNGLVEVDTDHVDVLREMIASMAGTPVESGGVFRFNAGVSRSVALSFTDDDIVDDADVHFIPKQTRASLVNAVFGEFHDPSQIYQQTALPQRIAPSDEVADGGEQHEESYGFPFVTSGTQGQRLLEILRRDARHQRRVSLTLRPRFVVLEVGDWVEWTSARYGLTNFKFRISQITINPNLTIDIELKEVSESIYAWNPLSDELDPILPQTVGDGGHRLTTVQGLAVTNIVLPNGGAQQPGLRITWTPIDDPTVIGLTVQYRRVGDAVAMERPISQPSAGSYEWVDGIQGGSRYEVSVRPVTQPERSVAWTAWISPDENTAPQIVEVAAVAESVPPNTITPEMLSAQTRFELSLATAKAEIQGSVSAQLAEAFAWAQQTGEAALASLAAGHENGAQLLTERVERVNGQEALARRIETAITRIDENSFAVTEVIESIDGIKGRWTVTVNSNGVATGFATLSGDGPTTGFVVAANSFTYADPDIAGGTPQPVFVISEDPENPGQHRAYLNGELIADAIRAGAVSAGEVSAVFGSFGEMSAGLIRDPDNNIHFDIANMRIARTDNKMVLDFKNRVLRMEFD